MKKTVLFGLVGVMAVSSANAGWFDGLFGAKKAEPQTLEEACNKSEITSICPETLLGQKTLMECLTENVTQLSKKCATFVKKSALDKVDSVKQQVVDAKTAVQDMKDASKQQVADAKAEAAQKKAEQKAAIKEQKEAAKATKEEFKNSLKETKDAAKSIFTAPAAAE